MGEKRRILIQLDTDPRPSVFDAVVAVDAGAEVLLPYGAVRAEEVRDLVYGAIFTRGGDSLRSTAVFIGGSDAAAGEAVLGAATEAFIGPLRVSLMLDPAGASTTAAGAILAAERALGSRERALADSSALVLGATGPVGGRVLRLLARSGARVTAASRSLERAECAAADAQAAAGTEVAVGAASTAEPGELEAALEGTELVIAAGGPGVRLLSRKARAAAKELQVAIDLNAVPPEGIEGIEGRDAGCDRDGVVAYGAIGVGEIKMKIHKAAVASLFEANDRVLDVEEILEVGRGVFEGG